MGDGTTTERLTPVELISTNANLSALSLSNGRSNVALNQTFSEGTTGYTANVGNDVSSITVTATKEYPDANIQVIDDSFVGLDVKADVNRNFALKNDGTIWAWGWNMYGQLGDGTTTDRLTPVKVSGLTGVTAISVGFYHTVALKSDGTVWAWGYNGCGQLGDGTTTDRPTPVQVSGLIDVTSISAGGCHTLALKNDGTVWAWGLNYKGELGDGTKTDRLTPVQVSGLTGVTAISVGSAHTLALKSDGTVWGWGDNEIGQLGDGTTTDRLTPVKVNGLTGVTAISAGAWHIVALKRDGTVWAWGKNGNGQLGDGTTTYMPTPVQVSGLTGVTAISAGFKYTVALKNDGTVWAWGWNGSGQLGDGTTTDRSTPVQVSDLTGVTAISAGSYHTVALKRDGTVWAWGLNGSGQLGDGTTTDRATPVQVKVKVNGQAVTSGERSFALNLAVGENTIEVVVTAQDGTTQKTYTVTVTRAPSTNANEESLKNMIKIDNNKDYTNHWANQFIQKWINSGWIKGYSDGTFRPDNMITRSEVITLINRSFQLKSGILNISSYYSDVEPFHWYYSEVNKAIHNKYLYDFGTKKFDANDFIDRQEVAYFIYKVLNLPKLTLTSNFKDTMNLTWSKDAINSIIGNGIMNGYPDNTFKPNNKVTRAETVVILERALNWSSK